MAQTTTRRLTINKDIRSPFKYVPYIRLTGLWLQKAGFEPGAKIEVTVRQNELTIKTAK